MSTEYMFHWLGRHLQVLLKQGSSDGILRLGLEMSLETHICQSLSRRFQGSSLSQRLKVSVTSLLP